MTVETSIIVRAYNEARHLPALFEAIAQQEYQDYETIMVDSGSIDGSREIAAQFGHKVIRISSHDFTFGHSLNVGVEAANGKFIAIVSAHTVPLGTKWLGKLIAPLRLSDTAMVYGRQMGVRQSKFSEVEDLRRFFGPDAAVPPPAPNNANAAIRRDLWEQQAFDETLPGLEDLAWARYWVDKDYRVIYEPDAALYHIHEETWRQVRRRHHREAMAALSIGVRGRRDILTDPIKEFGFAIADLSRALRPKENPTADRLPTIPGRIKEILLYRANRGYGTIRGLLDGSAMSSPEFREKFFFDRSSRAVVIRGPRKATLEDVQVRKLRPGELLIRVAHVAVCSTDLELYEGKFDRHLGGPTGFPVTPGQEYSGHIAAFGSRVAGFLVGDPVVVRPAKSCGACPACSNGRANHCIERTDNATLGSDGAYADYVAVPARFVRKLPPGFNMRKATLVEPTAVVLQGLRRLFERVEDTKAPCAVVGTGLLAYLAALILRKRGHLVTAFASQQGHLKIHERNGIPIAHDSKQLETFQAVIETGPASTRLAALRYTPSGTSILLLGPTPRALEYSLDDIAAQDKAVIGSSGSTFSDFESAIRILPGLDLSPFLNVTYPLHEFGEAWKKSNDPDILKVIVDVRK